MKQNGIINMKREEIIDYIKLYIERKHDLPYNTDFSSLNFLSGGYIDSIELFLFLAELEEHYDIEFTDDEISSPATSTGGELADLILKKRSSN